MHPKYRGHIKVFAHTRIAYAADGVVALLIGIANGAQLLGIRNHLGPLGPYDITIGSMEIVTGFRGIINGIGLPQVDGPVAQHARFFLVE